MTGRSDWRLVGAMLLCLLCGVVGCSGPAGPANGSVRFDDGTPVTSGSIEFRNRKSRQLYASRLTSEGAFQLAGKEGRLGLPPGAYEVVVVQVILTEDLAKESHTHGQTVPRRFNDYYTTDLAMQISENQPEPLDLVVPVE